MEPSHGRWVNRGNTRNVILLACLVAILTRPAPGAQAVVAAALLALGSALHVLVKGSLIRNVKLCQTGPYRLCRHPYYLASFIIDSSFCLLTGNPYVLVLLPFLFFWGYGPSLRSEEARLSEIHGDDYVRFSAGTPQLFPDTSPGRWGTALFADFAVRRLTRNEVRRTLRFWGAFLGLLGLQGGWAAVRGGVSLTSAVLLPAVWIPGATALGLSLAVWALPRRRASPDESGAEDRAVSVVAKVENGAVPLLLRH